MEKINYDTPNKIIQMENDDFLINIQFKNDLFKTVRSHNRYSLFDTLIKRLIKNTIYGEFIIGIGNPKNKTFEKELDKMFGEYSDMDAFIDGKIFSKAECKARDKHIKQLNKELVNND